MFNTLKEKLTSTIGKLRNKSLVSDQDIQEMISQIRMSLLEADVSLVVVKYFISELRAEIEKSSIRTSANPCDIVINILKNTLLKILGEKHKGISIKNEKKPVFIMMMGLQGSGKTTSSAKIARIFSKGILLDDERIQKKEDDKNSEVDDVTKFKVLMVSYDIHRPAAMKQLEVLGKSINVDTLIMEGEKISNIVTKTKEISKNYDVVILDTAGRTQIDSDMMQELSHINKSFDISERILVVDSMLGQEAISIAQKFNEDIGISGIVMTKVDGDSHGGAAISVRYITKAPIKYLCSGEKVEDIEAFHPDRISQRILDMGDIASLMEQASQIVKKNDVEKITNKLQKGQFDLNDMAFQLKTITKMGGLGKIMSFMPGNSAMKEKMSSMEGNNQKMKRHLAIIYSMTAKERSTPYLLNGSRKSRIAKGSGVQVKDVNALLKQYGQMSNMVSGLSKMDKNKMAKLSQMMMGNKG